jgi:hypothetical protein
MLIEKIVLTPGSKRGTILATLHGEIAHHFGLDQSASQ